MGSNEALLRRLLKNKSENFINCDEETQEEVARILLNLNVAERTPSEKYRLVRIYLDNKDKVSDISEFKSLICHSLVTSTLSYEEQIKLLNKYLEDETTYNETIKYCHKVANII